MQGHLLGVAGGGGATGSHRAGDTCVSHGGGVWAEGPAQPAEGSLYTPGPVRQGGCVCTNLCVCAARVGIRYRGAAGNL